MRVLLKGSIDKWAAMKNGCLFRLLKEKTMLP